MKKYIIWFVIGIIILLVAPVYWKDEIVFDLPKFLEEYYKQCFSLIQLLIAFAFFTLLYQYVESQKTIKRLSHLKNKICTLLNDLSEIKNRDLHVEKIFTLLNLYIGLFKGSNVNEDEDLLFYGFACEIVGDFRSIRQFNDNNDIFNENIYKVNERFKRFEKAVNNVHDDHAS